MSSFQIPKQHPALSWDIENLLFYSFLDMSRHVGPHPKKWNEHSFHWRLTVLKKLRQSINFFQRHWQFVILEHFGHAGTFATKPKQNDMNFFNFHRCLNTCKNWTQLPEFFLEVLEFKESCNLIYSFFEGYNPTLFFHTPFFSNTSFFKIFPTTLLKIESPLAAIIFL